MYLNVLVHVNLPKVLCEASCEGRDVAIASGGQIFGGEIEVLKEYSLWLFLGL